MAIDFQPAVAQVGPKLIAQTQAVDDAFVFVNIRPYGEVQLCRP
jgi:hypothetical protein